MDTILDMELGGIEDTVQILLGRLEMGYMRGNQPLPSICMVPYVLRDVSPLCFSPRVVSIGPLHNKYVEKLKEFEGQKMSFMYELLDGLSSSREQMLKLCVKRVAPMIDQIRTCYAGSILTTYNDSELTAMMVTDSCFILRFLYNDSLMIENRVLYNTIGLDLLLLENQIPFFVLEQIYECTVSKAEPSVPLTEMFLRKLLPFHPFGRILKPESIIAGGIDDDTTTPDHILGFLHQLINLQSDDALSEITVRAFHSARNLRKSGVRFKPNHDINRPMAIDFKAHWSTCFCWPWCKPTLRMPILRISYEGERVLRNFIAYEQSSAKVNQCVTSYVVALRMLVDSKKDLQTLAESKIIESLVSPEQTINMIDELIKGVVLKRFLYIREWVEMLSYSNSYIGHMRRTYFSGAWSYIASFSGLILFILTLIQTYCSIRAI